MELLVNYKEYCDTLNIKYDEGTETPDWFDNYQYLALAIISSNMAQLHLFPQSYSMFLMLKDDYKKQFTRALCNQIQFINNNIDIFNDPVAMEISSTIGNYSRTGLGPMDVAKFQTKICPITYAELLSMGWLFAGIDKKLPLQMFYDLSGE